MKSIKMTPNILIHANKQDIFIELKSLIRSIVGTNSFTIYNINTESLRKSTAWINNCALLIDCCSDSIKLPEKSDILFSNYLKSGGTVLSILLADTEVSEINNEELLLSSICLYPMIFQGTHYVTKVTF